MQGRLQAPAIFLIQKLRQRPRGYRFELNCQIVSISSRNRCFLQDYVALARARAGGRARVSA